jgi:hypothetical protein
MPIVEESQKQEKENYSVRSMDLKDDAILISASDEKHVTGLFRILRFALNCSLRDGGPERLHFSLPNKVDPRAKSFSVSGDLEEVLEILAVNKHISDTAYKEALRVLSVNKPSPTTSKSMMK